MGKRPRKARPVVLPPRDEDAALWTDATRLCRRLGIGEDWDYLLVGDGSGTGSARPVGWGSTSLDRTTGEVLSWDGAVNRGTVNFAELMAYMAPLNWLSARAADGPRAVRNVHIVTDSQYAQQSWDDPARRGVKNAGPFAALDAYHRAGFRLHWHWLPRDECELNRLADRIARQARLRWSGYNPGDGGRPTPRPGAAP